MLTCSVGLKNMTFSPPKSSLCPHVIARRKEYKLDEKLEQLKPELISIEFNDRNIPKSDSLSKLNLHYFWFSQFLAAVSVAVNSDEVQKLLEESRKSTARLRKYGNIDFGKYPNTSSTMPKFITKFPLKKSTEKKQKKENQEIRQKDKKKQKRRKNVCLLCYS